MLSYVQIIVPAPQVQLLYSSMVLVARRAEKKCSSLLLRSSRSSPQRIQQRMNLRAMSQNILQQPPNIEGEIISRTYVLLSSRCSNFYLWFEYRRYLKHELRPVQTPFYCVYPRTDWSSCPSCCSPKFFNFIILPSPVEILHRVITRV